MFVRTYVRFTSLQPNVCSCRFAPKNPYKVFTHSLRFSSSLRIVKTAHEERIEMPAIAPNPVILTASLPDGGIVRFYHNGMVDAIDGSFYSLSPGFDSLAGLLTWLAEETRRGEEPFDIQADWNDCHSFNGRF